MLYDQLAYPSPLIPNSPTTDQSSFTALAAVGIPINIQPESPQMVALTGGEVYATYHFFSPVNVELGWRLTIGSDTYKVRGVQRFTYGAGQHYEGTLVKDHQ